MIADKVWKIETFLRTQYLKIFHFIIKPQDMTPELLAALQDLATKFNVHLVGTATPIVALDTNFDVTAVVPSV